MKWDRDKLRIWGYVVLILFIFGLILTVYNIYPLTYMTIIGLINLAILLWVI